MAMPPATDLQRAREAFDAGRFSEAGELCHQVLAVNSKQPQALELAGRLAFRAGSHDEGLAWIERAVTAHTRNPHFPLLLGTLHEELGRFTEARRWYLRAIAVRPGFAAAHRQLCNLQKRNGRPDHELPVSVIIASVGTDTLRQAVESVLGQTYARTELTVVADGPDFAPKVRAVLGDLAGNERLRLLELPENTGADGFFGHRIYAALSFLVHGHFLSFLDEDNWFEPEHVASLVDVCTSRGLAWAYALRRIVDDGGGYLCNDDCESLGRWPAGNTPQIHHIDTNCYFLRRDLAVRVAPVWNRRGRDGISTDTSVCRQLLGMNLEYGTNGLYSVNYRVGQNPMSVKADFFHRGNNEMRRRYPDGFPWRQAGGEVCETGTAAAVIRDS